MYKSTPKIIRKGLIGDRTSCKSVGFEINICKNSIKK